MQVLSYPVGRLDANCHIVIGTDKKCLIIDFGGDFSRIWSELKRQNLQPLAVLLTHGHYDHIEGALEAQSYVPIYVFEEELKFLNDSSLNLSRWMGAEQKKFFENTLSLQEGEMKIGNFAVDVIHTAGHTIGSCCFAIKENGEKNSRDVALFSGDTIMKGSYGRYDFPTGDFSMLCKSVVEILDRFDDEVVLFTGHGDNTTIKYEKKFNELYLYAKNNL